MVLGAALLAEGAVNVDERVSLGVRRERGRGAAAGVPPTVLPSRAPLEVEENLIGVGAPALGAPLNAVSPPGVGGRLEAGGAGVRLVVRDEGAGIPPGDLPHLFKRFYRADPARARDPGLGLSIAAWIVEQHGGQITLTSELRQGAHVEVVFARGPGLTPGPQE